MTRTLKAAAVVIGMLLVAGAPPAAQAQRASETPPPNGSPTVRSPRDSARLMALRAAFQRRVAERVQRELDLTAEQSAKLQEVASATQEQRRALMDQERAVRQALRDQLKPGIAADQDSVSRLITALVNTRVTAAENRRQEVQNLSGILSPVQQARYMMLQEQLARRIDAIRTERGRSGARGRGQPARPRNRPAPPPPAPAGP